MDAEHRDFGILQGLALPVEQFIDLKGTEPRWLPDAALSSSK
jgi:hypothetical protein